MELKKKIQIHLDDLDFMGIVSHYQWIKLFERARTELLKPIWKSFLDQNLNIAIAHVDCRYRLPARYDDQITIELKAKKVGSRSMSLQHTARNEENQIVADALIKGIFVNEKMKPSAISNPIKTFFKNLGESND